MKADEYTWLLQRCQKLLAEIPAGIAQIDASDMPASRKLIFLRKVEQALERAHGHSESAGPFLWHLW